MSVRRVKLNRKQRAFVKEYLIDFNATQAAKRAGYSERTAYSIGHNLLKNIEIHKAIEAELMTPTEIRKRIEDIATGGAKAQDKLRALKLAGQIHKMFTEKVDGDIRFIVVREDEDTNNEGR